MLTEILSRWNAVTSRNLVTAVLIVSVAAAPFLVAFQGGFPPQEEGTPILIVESYTTTPTPVRSGEAFTLNVTLKNTGTKHADDIFASVASSSAFVGLGSPAPVGKLDPGFSASFALRVQAPDNVSSGAMDLPLAFLYRIGTSGAFELVRSVGIQVSGGTGTAGQPQVVIESAEVLTAPNVEGDRFEISLTLHNIGTRRAARLTASPKLNDNLSPAEGSGTTQVGDIDAGQSTTFSLAMVLDQPSPSGRVLQTIGLEYTDTDGKRYTSEETAALDLGTAGRRRPQLIVADYATNPERPAPGEQFTLSVRISNVGAGDARRVLLRLGDEAGLKPFAPLGTSNVTFVSEIGAGVTATTSQTLLVEGAAQGGVYPLRLALIYENIVGESQSETEIISLVVLTRPQLKISLFEPLAEPLVVSQTFEIPIEVINVGRQAVNVSTVEVVSEDLALTEASLYLGPLDAGTSGSLVPGATASVAGSATATVVVHYLDDLNQEQTVTETLTFTIVPPDANAPDSTDEAGEPSVWERLWQGILGFFGLGG
jgi:hypothetical protein